MNTQAIRHCECPQDQGEGILLADIETETIPRIDQNGNVLYYCLQEHHIFSVPTNKTVTDAVREVVTVA